MCNTIYISVALVIVAAAVDITDCGCCTCCYSGCCIAVVAAVVAEVAAVVCTHIGIHIFRCVK